MISTNTLSRNVGFPGIGDVTDPLFLKACAHCGTAFCAEGDLCGKCREQPDANREHDIARLFEDELGVLK